jgi:hypothetical protein
MGETLPLATLHEAVLDYLRGREDAVLFGAPAVNAYANEPRMTQDADIISTRARELGEELRERLNRRFHVALRLCEVAGGRGFRLYQARKDGNRRLADVRLVSRLPDARRIAEVLVISPVELSASKLIACHRRRGQPKAGTDWRDLAMLCLVFPELKTEAGPVTDYLHSREAEPAVLTVWQELCRQEIIAPDEDDKFWS